MHVTHICDMYACVLCNAQKTTYSCDTRDQDECMWHTWPRRMHVTHVTKTYACDTRDQDECEQSDGDGKENRKSNVASAKEAPAKVLCVYVWIVWVWAHMLLYMYICMYACMYVWAHRLLYMYVCMYVNGVLSNVFMYPLHMLPVYIVSVWAQRCIYIYIYIYI